MSVVPSGTVTSLTLNRQGTNFVLEADVYVAGDASVLVDVLTGQGATTMTLTGTNTIGAATAGGMRCPGAPASCPTSLSFPFDWPRAIAWSHPHPLREGVGIQTLQNGLCTRNPPPISGLFRKLRFFFLDFFGFFLFSFGLIWNCFGFFLYFFLYFLHFFSFFFDFLFGIFLNFFRIF